MHILLVDDNPENSVALADILKTEGHSVDTASDGYEALDVIRTNEFDVIVSDALMPKMDGFVLCRKVRADQAYKDLPFIIMTGEYTGDADEQFARTVGATRVLRKTGEADELIATLNLLKGRSSESQEQQPTPESLDDVEYLKRYNSLLVRKIESKMAELRAVNNKLIERDGQLDHEHRKYRQLFASANDGILLVRQADTGIVESNIYARKLLKLDEKVVSQKKLREFTPFGELLAEKILQGEAIRFQSSFEQEDSKTILDINGAPVGTVDSLYLIILRDVTRGKEWLERFIAFDKFGALGRLSNGLVHEIRNPLNVVSVNLQYLDRKFDDDSPERQLTKAALSGVSAIEKIIRETMNFAQPQTPAKTEMRLRPLLNEIATLAGTSLQKSRIRLSVEKGEIDDTIFADRSQVLHALLNIVQNAIDAMPAGGKLVFKLDGVSDGEDIVLYITDTGVGMDEDVAKLAIEPFYTTKGCATGMGLSISNRLFELNDAGLTCESRPGGGTTVAVRFQRRREA